MAPTHRRSILHSPEWLGRPYDVKGESTGYIITPYHTYVGASTTTTITPHAMADPDPGSILARRSALPLDALVSVSSPVNCSHGAAPSSALCPLPSALPRRQRYTGVDGTSTATFTRVVRPSPVPVL